MQLQQLSGYVCLSLLRRIKRKERNWRSKKWKLKGSLRVSAFFTVPYSLWSFCLPWEELHQSRSFPHIWCLSTNQTLSAAHPSDILQSVHQPVWWERFSGVPDGFPKFKDWEVYFLPSPPQGSSWQIYVFLLLLFSITDISLALRLPPAASPSLIIYRKLKLINLLSVYLRVCSLIASDVRCISCCSKFRRKGNSTKEVNFSFCAFKFCFNTRPGAVIGTY